MRSALILFWAALSPVFALDIFVIGDSHVKEFAGIDHLTTHHLGPLTMHRIARDGLDAVNLKKMGVKEGDVAIFVFGEIDVRCHIGRQRDLKGRDLEEVMQTLVWGYLRTILQNQAQFKNLTCIVYSITPPTDTIYNIEYPRYGTLEERIQITQAMNYLLKIASQQYGIQFLDVYEDYTDALGALNTELSDGNVHIGSQYNGAIRQNLSQLLSIILCQILAY